MDRQEVAVRIGFDNLSRGECNRAVQELRELLRETVSDDVVISIERQDADSQDAGSVLVLLFGTTSATVIAHGIRAYLARRSDPKDQITIKTKDGLEVIATGEAARRLDASALLRAANKPHKGH
jgi:hypothetical protein